MSARNYYAPKNNECIFSLTCFSQALNNTTNPLDLALNGRGWFQVTMPNGEINYTRAGSFNLGPNGEIVTLDGYQVDPGFTVPAETTNIVVNKSGEIYAQIPGQTDPQLLGQIAVRVQEAEAAPGHRVLARQLAE